MWGLKFRLLIVVCLSLYTVVHFHWENYTQFQVRNVFVSCLVLWSISSQLKIFPKATPINKGRASNPSIIQWVTRVQLCPIRSNSIDNWNERMEKEEQSGTSRESPQTSSLCYWFKPKGPKFGPMAHLLASDYFCRDLKQDVMIRRNSRNS